VSVDDRHAPEGRFPAAVDDAFAALRWVSSYAEALGGHPGAVAAAGWSAGANLATVVCRLARDAGGPPIAGPLLIAPVTDADLTRRSYRDNGERCVLTSAIMQWFFDHGVAAAGVDVRHIKARGHIHSSLRTVDLAISGALHETSSESCVQTPLIAAAGCWLEAGRLERMRCAPAARPDQPVRSARNPTEPNLTS